MLIKYEDFKSFQVNSDDLKGSFLFKLANENVWTIEFSELVYHEYLRFIYLCALSEDMLVPSKVIDQVWHLHLSYTNSYWIEMCEGIFDKNIYHVPSDGSECDRRKLFESYQSTLHLYREVFDEEPPSNIWGRSNLGFDDEDTSSHVILSKKSKIGMAIVTTCFSVIVALIDTNMFIVWSFILGFAGLLIFFLKGDKGRINRNRDDDGADCFSCSSDFGGAGCGGSSD
jgi:hypothetical protein